MVISLGDSYYAFAIEGVRILNIYLFIYFYPLERQSNRERQTERERQGGAERSFICWSIAEMPMIARAGPS